MDLNTVLRIKVYSAEQKHHIPSLQFYCHSVIEYLDYSSHEKHIYAQMICCYYQDIILQAVCSFEMPILIFDSGGYWTVLWLLIINSLQGSQCDFYHFHIQQSYAVV